MITSESAVTHHITTSGHVTMMTWTVGSLIGESGFAASMLPKACMTKKAWKACIIFGGLGAIARSAPCGRFLAQ